MKILGLSLWYADAGKHLAERAENLLGKVGVDRWIWSVRPSNDPTADLLRFMAGTVSKPVEIVSEPHEQPRERIERLSKAGDMLLDLVKDEDWVVWHESDLLTYPTVATDLLRAAESSGADVVGGWPVLSHDDRHPTLKIRGTPVQMKLPCSIMYDTLAYRMNGQKFTNNPPYHPDIKPGWNRMDSVGSVMLVRGDYIRRGARMDGYGVMRLCDNVRRLGGWVTYDESVPVVQPVEHWTYQNDS